MTYSRASFPPERTAGGVRPATEIALTVAGQPITQERIAALVMKASRFRKATARSQNLIRRLGQSANRQGVFTVPIADFQLPAPASLTGSPWR